MNIIIHTPHGAGEVEEEAHAHAASVPELALQLAQLLERQVRMLGTPSYPATGLRYHIQSSCGYIHIYMYMKLHHF